MSGSSPARVGTTSSLRWVVYLVDSSDRDTRQTIPAALRLRTERRENYLNKEKWDFYGYTDTLDRKVRLRGEMKGLPERFPIAETKAKPFLVFCDVE